MEDNLSEIKAKIDIADLISGYVNLKKAGRNYRGLCPFHSEKTPSFMVSPELQIFKCFGCGEGGDIFSFIRKIESLEFPAALRLLAERAGVKLKSSKDGIGESRKERIYKINKLAGDFFHFILVGHPIGSKAQAYLKKREVSPETTRLFFLGYAPDSWGSLSSFLIKKGFSPSEIVESGLGIPRKNPSQSLPIYDRFRSRLVFPLRDQLGRTVSFSGRALGEKIEPKYLNGPETSVFKKGSFLFGLDLAKQEIKKAGEAIVVEGQFDALLPYQEGFRNIVACLGTALTETQLNLLSRLTNKLLLAFDADLAGSEAALRSVRLAENLGFTVSIPLLPEGLKDPDEAVRAGKPVFSKSLSTALPFYDFYLNHLSQGLESGDIRRKKEIAEKFLRELAVLESPITRSFYLGRLSKVLDLKIEVLADVLKGFAGKNRSSGAKTDGAKDNLESRDRLETLQRYLLALLPHAPLKTAKEVLTQLSDEYFLKEDLRGLFDSLRTIIAASKSPIDVKGIRDKLGGPELETFEDLYLGSSARIPEGKEAVSSEARLTAKEIKKELAKRMAEAISARIGLAEEEGNLGEIKDLRLNLQKVMENLE